MSEQAIGPNDAIPPIRDLVAGLREHQKRYPTRATSLAITKLEEAAMWLEHTDSRETG